MLQRIEEKRSMYMARRAFEGYEDRCEKIREPSRVCAYISRKYVDIPSRCLSLLSPVYPAESVSCPGTKLFFPIFVYFSTIRARKFFVPRGSLFLFFFSLSLFFFCSRLLPAIGEEECIRVLLPNNFVEKVLERCFQAVLRHLTRVARRPGVAWNFVRQYLRIVYVRDISAGQTDAI